MIETFTLGRFPLGRLVITPTARAAISAENGVVAICRHLDGDWGDLDERERKQNDAALKYGFPLFSCYATPDGTKFCIITEHDRSVTTVVLMD